MPKKRVSTRSTQKPVVSPVIIALVVAGSLVLVGGLIWLGNLQSTNASVTIDLGEFPAAGDAEAPVTIVEYSDFGCHHCRDFNLETADLIQEEYVETGQVEYIVHSFNLGRPETALAAEAAWCAADQGHYFEYQRAVFENFGTPYDQSNLINLAGRLEGLDQDAFAECLSSRTHQVDVETARRAAARRGINSTPTFFINDQRVEGNQPFEIFQSIIEQELAQTQQ